MGQLRLQQTVSHSDSDRDLQLARKDAVSALTVWILLEGLSLLILPSFQLIHGESKLFLWLSITVPLGLIGAVLIGVSSWWVKWTQEKIDRQAQNKRFYVTLAQAIGWFGLVGVGLPIIIVGLELWLAMIRGPQ